MILIKNTLKLFVIFLAITYTVGSFIAWDLNISHWDITHRYIVNSEGIYNYIDYENIRSVIVLELFISLVIAFAFTDLKKKNVI